jgi:DNA-binding NarL/FixJ family response regulator
MSGLKQGSTLNFVHKLPTPANLSQRRAEVAPPPTDATAEEVVVVDGDEAEGSKGSNRPTVYKKYTDTNRARAVDLLRAGKSYNEVAKETGVNKETVKSWNRT